MRGDYKFIGDFHLLVANGLNINVGSWHPHTINLVELYEYIGGAGKPVLRVLGFFCDSDNTGGESLAFFNDVTLSSKPQ